MLLSMRVHNFRSLRSEQSFRFHSKTRNGSADPRVAVLFGPNGSGKTNLIRSLATLKELTTQSAALSKVQFADLYQPFQFDESQYQPTRFEIEIFLDGSRFIYSLSYNAERILFERLLVYRTGKPQRWFEREYNASEQTERWAPFSSTFGGPRELWRRMTGSRALFLSTAGQLHCQQLQPLLRWFEQGLRIYQTQSPPDMRDIIHSMEEPAVKDRALKILRAVDIPIQDLRVIADSEDPSSSTLEFLYRGNSGNLVWLNTKHEARGIVRLVALLGPLLHAIRSGSLFVADEMPSGLHPLVADFLIRFAKTPTDPSSTFQLLATSHDATLMTSHILDHEEIWLMERKGFGSQLTSISACHPRRRECISRGYLRGRYGGIPVIATGADDWSLSEPATARAQSPVRGVDFVEALVAHRR